MKKISIIALGKLGLELYHTLEKDSEYLPCGTYHSKPKPVSSQVKYDITNDKLPEEVIDSDIVFFNLTPTTIISEKLFLNFIEQLKDQHLIFISSTSVYGNQGSVSEKTPPHPITENGKLLLSCEKIIQEKTKHYTIIRPGGIYTDSTNPSYYLSGRSDIKDGNHHVNLIHLKDIVKVVLMTLKNNQNQIINCVNIHHPLKRDYYSQFCERNSVALPHFSCEVNSDGKIVETIYEEYKITSKLP